MTELPIYHVNAFVNGAFTGNPAAVVPLNFWLPEEAMQTIAFQNNLSETAFFVRTNEGFHIRWFTPTIEVDLCGHATLAAAYIIFEELKYSDSEILLDSKSGILKVEKSNNLYYLDFPTAQFEKCEASLELIEAIGAKPTNTYKAKDDYMMVYDNQEVIEKVSPSFSLLKNVQARGVIITSKSSDQRFDFASRFFGPASGVDEDPVTGSAHTKLIPFWANFLGKNELIAKQVSKRGGLLYCELKGERVKIGGSASLYLIGKIFV